MSEAKKNFWEHHSINYLNMAFGESYSETIETPDGYARTINNCGDSLEFFLVGTTDLLEYVSYRVEGCINMEVCANTISHLTKGRPAPSPDHLTACQVIDFLETLPAHEHHCAEIAAATFNEAVKNMLSKD